MNTKAIAKRQDNAVAAPQVQRHVEMKDILLSPAGQAKLAEYAQANVDPKQLARLALFMATKNETLGKCSPMSVLAALTDCARLGLEPGGRAGGAYLVPYWNAKKGGYEAQMQTDYRGEIQLLRRGRIIADVRAHLVYANEKFEEIGGLRPNLIHEKRALDPNRGGLVGCYGVIYYAASTGIEPKWLVLTKADVERRREKSQSWQSHVKKGYQTPWVTDEEAMWLKTAIRAIAAKEPVDVVGREYARWATIEDARDMGDAVALPADDQDEPVPPKAATEELEEELVREMEIDRAVAELPAAHPEAEPNFDDLK